MLYLSEMESYYAGASIKTFLGSGNGGFIDILAEDYPLSSRVSVVFISATTPRFTSALGEVPKASVLFHFTFNYWVVYLETYPVGGIC